VFTKSRASDVDEREMESPFLERESLAVEPRDEWRAGAVPVAGESPFLGVLGGERASGFAAEAFDFELDESPAALENEYDAFAADEEYERLPSTGRPTAATVDADAAEPIFTGKVRAPQLPLLDTAAAKTSSRWNQARHPAVSGITLGELRARLEQYIDRPAVDAALSRANAGAAATYGTDEATVVTLLAHQFQRKTCRTPTIGDVARRCTVDGRLAEDTLDALGFVYHTGKDLNAADRANSVATATLRRVAATAFADIEPGLKASTWWSYMVGPPWLGMPIKHGIHIVLLKKLRRAQGALMRLPAFDGLSPAELGRVLGIEEEHKGARPTSPDWSMHLFGLGIDIGYTRNPWLSNPRRDTAKIAAITLRAARLVGSPGAGSRGISARWLHDVTVAQRDSAAIYRTLADWTRWLQEYFALAGNAKRLEGLLPMANITYPGAGWFKRDESLAAAAVRWARQVRTDFDDFAVAVARGSNKDAVRHGFMDLARDLVIALRDEACLGWGAVDFGPGASGDVMHFDCRVDGIGRSIATTAGRAFVPQSGHPCLPAPSAVQREFEEQVPRKAPPPPLCTVPKTPVGHWLTAALSRAIPEYTDARGKKQLTGCAINVPDALWQKTKIDLMVFFHGDPGPCTDCFETAPAKTEKKFGLDTQILNAPRKLAVAVPVIHWVPGNKNDDANIRGKWSAANFNAFVAEVLVEIQTQSGMKNKVELGSLVIAGHSHAYGILTPLALEFNQGAEATKKGALKNLQEVWALDSTYGVRSVRALEAWAYTSPHVRFVAVLNKWGAKAGQSKRPIDGWNAYYDKWRSFGFGPPANLRMCTVAEGHCAIPTKYVGNLLSTNKSSADWCTP
jgi:hypothetical protein